MSEQDEPPNPVTPQRRDASDAAAEQFALRLDLASALLPPANPNRVLRKAVSAIHSYPTNGVQTRTTRRLLNAMVVHAQDVFAKMEAADKERLKETRGTPIFKVAVKRLMQLMGWGNSNGYDQVYEALAAIYQWQIRWDLMSDAGEQSELLEQVNGRLLSQWGKGLSSRSGWISFEIPHDVLLMLMEPHPYAQIDLRVVNELGSGYAIGLYENTVRYLGTVHKVTAVRSVEEWARIIAGDGKYPGDFKGFNRYVLKPAIKWLEKVESCPFTVEPRLVYGPRKKVVGLQFKMRLKTQASLEMDMPPTWDPRTFEILRKVYGMADKEITLLTRTTSEAELQEAMARDSAMMTRKLAAGETVTNRSAYLRGILRNLQQGKPKDAEPEVDAEELNSKSVQGAVTRVVKLQEEFAAFRKERLKDVLGDLPESAISELRDEFERLQVQGLMKQWLKAGWSKPHPGLMASFLTWLLKEKPDLVDRLLPRPEEREFAVWMMLQQDGQLKLTGAA